MTESPTEERSREVHKGLRWTQLFHAFRLSLSVPQILIAAAGVVALAGGQWLFAQLPFAPEDASRQTLPWSKIIEVDTAGGTIVEPVVSSCLRLLALPVMSVYRPASVLLSPNNDWSSAAYAWTQLFWALIVWAIVGGALTRIAAVQFAVEQSVGLRTAIRFSAGRFLPFLTAPLLPGAGLLLLWMLGLVGGWIGAIPSAGPVIAGALWFLGFLVAFVMALIVIGIAGGWPLMYATISTEDSDAFDGFSRAFSYVFSRPRQWAGLTIASLIFGVIATGIGIGVAVLVVYLTAWSTSSGMGVGEVARLMEGSPFPLPKAFQSTSTAEAESLGATLALFWLNVLAVVVCGFAISLFWSLSTVMYFVLRHDDDGTPLDEIRLSEEAEEDELLPLVGVAASDQPAIERPVADDNAAADEKSAESPADGSANVTVD